MSDTKTRKRDWMISVFVAGEWYPAPRYVTAETQAEAMELAQRLYPGERVMVG